MQSDTHDTRLFSCEFFPPKTPEGTATLRTALATLAELNPAFFSVTFGAGGSTREGTFEVIKEIQTQGLNGAPHISCIGTTRADVRGLLHAYQDIGVKRLVALRGDLPSGMVERGEFAYANELVAFIREASGDAFHIEVAAYPECHPEATSPKVDLKNFKRKITAGANSAITQYFYSAEAYLRFVQECEAEDIHVPIVPGIMPITNYRQLARFSDNCGAEIPRWIRKKLEEYQDDLTSLRAFGLDVVTNLCAMLLEGGAPGLHFYTLNKHQPTRDIWKRLGL
jgi:methylenetetrahydrofolate reductase (NADPH)